MALVDYRRVLTPLACRRDLYWGSAQPGLPPALQHAVTGSAPGARRLQAPGGPIELGGEGGPAPGEARTATRSAAAAREDAHQASIRAQAAAELEEERQWAALEHMFKGLRGRGPAAYARVMDVLKSEMGSSGRRYNMYGEQTATPRKRPASHGSGGYVKTAKQRAGPRAQGRPAGGTTAAGRAGTPVGACQAQLQPPPLPPPAGNVPLPAVDRVTGAQAPTPPAVQRALHAAHQSYQATVGHRRVAAGPGPATGRSLQGQAYEFLCRQCHEALSAGAL